MAYQRRRICRHSPARGSASQFQLVCPDCQSGAVVIQAVRTLTLQPDGIAETLIRRGDVQQRTHPKGERRSVLEFDCDLFLTCKRCRRSGGYTFSQRDGEGYAVNIDRLIHTAPEAT